MLAVSGISDKQLWRESGYIDGSRNIFHVKIHVNKGRCTSPRHLKTTEKSALIAQVSCKPLF